jgi:oligopeptide transport system substrate-binding protein
MPHLRPFRRTAALLVLALLSACGQSGSDSGGATLRVDAVGTLDNPSSPPRQMVLGETQSGLVRFDAGGQPVPGLATSWRLTDDGHSIIFRLRQAKWSDGRQVRASDVVATFRRIMAPDSRNPLKPLLGTIVGAREVTAGTAPPTSLGVEAPVDNVVEIRLDAPTPELLQLLALPAAAVMRPGVDPPAGGPFTIADASHRPIRLGRNRYFHANDAVALAAIDVMPAADSIEAIARFTRGATDIVTGGGLVGLSDARTLVRARALHVEAAWGVYGYIANIAHGPLADVRVRQALAMSINRQALIDQLFAVRGMEPVRGLIPSTMTSVATPAQPGWATQSIEQRLATARDLLTAAGYGPGHPLSIIVSLPEGREHNAVLMAVAADWATIGVVPRLRVQPQAAHARSISRGDFDLAQVELVAPVDAPSALLAPFGCAVRLGGYCNTLVDRAQIPSRDRQSAQAQAEEQIVADAPLIALFTPLRWSLVAPNVTGWIDNPGGRHPLSKLDITKSGLNK